MSVTLTGGELDTKSMSGEVPSGGVSGSGGDLLYLWSLPGEERVTYAIHISAGEITNATERPLYVPGLTFPNNTPGGSERLLGEGTEGRLLDSEQLPIQGSITFADNSGTIIGSVPVLGEFKAAAPPSSGVTSGSNVSNTPTYNAFIKPSDGIARYEEDAPNAGYLDLRWVGVGGVVTDSRGTPVPNTTVQADGEGFTTDNTGRYDLLAPAGVDVSFVGLGGTSSRDVSPSAGDEIDFQYGGVSVSVTDPADGTPFEGVPVSVGGSVNQTGPDGIVEETQLGIGFHEVTIMDNYDLTVQVGFEGDHNSVGLGDVETSGEGGFTGVSVRVRDAETGRPVEGTSTKIPAQGIRSATGPDGAGSVLHDYPADGDNFEIVVADDDPRYNVAGIVRSPDADEDTVLVQVEPAIPTVDM